MSRRLRLALGAFVLAASALGCVAALPAATAAGVAPPALVVSPLPGTPDADPHTEISFLGAPASRLRNVVVTGSRSGVHAGRLEFYSTHTGGSFVPSTPFASGESVTVSATLVGYATPEHIETNFTVSSPYTLPPPSAATPTRATAANVVRFHSRKDLEPTAVTVTTPASDAALGDIFVTPDGGAGQAGPMIVAPNGQLVWFHPLPRGTTAFNLQVQRYQGVPVLTWWQGEIIGGHGQGVDEIESSRYTPLATVRAGNGLQADLHDFVITPQGTAWITAFAPQHSDLTAVGGVRAGLLDDAVVQEVDIKTGLVMFQWNALGHVPITDTYTPIPRQSVLDYFHVNSVDPLANGELLISGRNTWTTYLVSEADGSVIWELGGKHTSFALGPGVKFAWQHDAELLPDGTVSVFDNEAAPPESAQSRVLDVAVNAAAHTATLIRSLIYPGKPILSLSQGSVQPLANGDTFIGWGQAGEVSELSPAGALTFDMHFATPTSSYRAFRYPWTTQPETQPALIAAASGHQTRLYVSWNGATGVAAWRVLAGSTRASLKTVGTYPSQGFETAIAAPTSAPDVRVQALAADGTLLRSSPVVGR